jgi:hypothetical protein
LERFPERSREIEAARSIHDLLHQLEYDLQSVYSGRRAEPDLPPRVFDYAAWCFAPEQSWDLRNAAAVSFYEHVPSTEGGRRDMAERLPFGVVVELNALLQHMLPDGAYKALRAEIGRVHGRDLPPVSARAT